MNAEALAYTAIMVEKMMPEVLEDMSLLFRTELIAATCSRFPGKVTTWLGHWQANDFKLCTDDCKFILSSLSVSEALHLGVEAAFARCFKDVKGAIWTKGDGIWKQLETRFEPSDLSRRFINNIFSEQNGLQKWQMHQDTFQRDVHLKEFHQDFYMGAKGEHCHTR
jgi:hypothetical protein